MAMFIVFANTALHHACGAVALIISLPTEKLRQTEAVLYKLLNCPQDEAINKSGKKTSRSNIFIWCDMQTVCQIKEEISRLSYSSKIELAKYTRELVILENSQKLPLKEAAELMKDCYCHDAELTSFSSIEGEFYEEG